MNVIYYHDDYNGVHSMLVKSLPPPPPPHDFNFRMDLEPNIFGTVN